MAFNEMAEKPFRGLLVAATLEKNINDIPVLIDRPMNQGRQAWEEFQRGQDDMGGASR